MEIRDLALFLHILTLLAAIGLSATLHSAEWRSRGAQTVQELRLHGRTYAWGKLFPVFIFLLLATGYWLLEVKDARYEWGTPWVWTAVVALIILGILGGAVLDRHSGRYNQLLADTPDGPVSAELRAQATATVPWIASHLSTALAISVVFNMVNKPDQDIEAIGTLVVGAVAGSLLGWLGSRTPTSPSSATS